MPERRYFPSELRVERRADGSAVIHGYGAVFNQLSVPLWGFREKIEPGAFTRAVEKDDVRGLWQHDSNYVLGRNRAGTMRLEEDEVGLAYEIDPPDTQWARDAIVTMERGDVTQSSFQFETISDRWEEDKETGVIIRTLLEVKLYDVSPVTFPAYPQTSVGVRGLVEAGLAPELVHRALYRAGIGGLMAEDLEIMQRLQAYSRQFATELGQAPGSQSNGDEALQAPDFAAMRRELDILQIE